MPDPFFPQLGKIQKVRFGNGGYQDAMLGISFTLGGDGWGVGDFWGFWGMERSTHAKWTEAERVAFFGDMVMRIGKLLTDAKVDSIDKLDGIPVRVHWKNFNQLERWEVLKEVL